MSIANNGAQRARFVRAIESIQRQIEDLQREIDAAMAQPPAPAIQRLLAQTDVHLAAASAELGESRLNVIAIP